MSLETFGNWLYDSSVSTSIRDISWIIPTVQSIHILAISIIVGSALISDLRLAGVIATDETPSAVVRRYLPWMWIALAVLLLTGLVMVLAEPSRTLNNMTFWTKMGLILFAFVLTMIFRKPLLDPAFRMEHAGWAGMIKPAAWISLAVWIAVIFCGRWIAYT